MFKVGDHVVCPGHGVGQICDVESRNVGETEASFYIIKILSNNMKVMIPVNSKDGIRTLVSDEEVSEVFELLQNHEVEVDNSTWNRRHREYLLKIKTGSLIEIADVLRSLFLLKHTKNLSFGEKQMLEQCKSLLVEEISISNGAEEKEVSVNIENCFAS